MTTYESAREAVAAGADPHVVARELVTAMTAEEKLGCLDGDGPCWAGLTYLNQGGYHRSAIPAARVERLGVPGFAFADGPRGVVVDRATCFPVCMARGATWDVELEERIGEAIGRELRAVGGDLFGGVCVNVLRHPAWGRAQETFGEDPHHVGELGAALSRGVQKHAMACVKHFACNSMENARFTVDVSIDEVALHEVYLPHFKRVVDDGVAVVMSAYNTVNGEMCGDSPTLLTGVLRDEWGFDGFVISDFVFGIRDAAVSLRAGLDVEMPYQMVRSQHLRAALDAGEATWTDVDRSVERILATILRFDPGSGRGARDRTVLANADHRSLAREAAAKSVVLLRNEDVDGAPALPIDPSTVTSLAVVGPYADEVNLGDGGSSDVWAPYVVSPLVGLRAAFPDARVAFHDGAEPTKAGSVAAGADAAVVVVGYTYRDEGEYIGDTSHLAHLFPGPDDPDAAAAFEAEIAAEPHIDPPPHVAARGTGGFETGGDRTSLRLRAPDVDLIRAVAAANPRTVVAIVAGSAVVMSEWDEDVPAILQSWYSGMEGGHGLADVITGTVSPSGRLPFTVPSEESHLPPFDRDATSFTYDRWHGWWMLERDGNEAAYPFGFGLSYTSFTLDAAQIEVTPAGLSVRSVVRNDGPRDGSDVVQVYAHRAGTEHPSRLVGFGRVEVPAGGSAELVLDVPLERLAERDVDAHAMVVPPGDRRIRVARHSADDGITATVVVSPISS